MELGLTGQGRAGDRIEPRHRPRRGLGLRRGGLRPDADGTRRAGAGRGRQRRYARKGRKAAVEVLDLRDAERARARWSRRSSASSAGLDILVNNAGTTKRGDFFALTDADWEEGYALKFFAHVRLARAAWPLLKAAPRLAGRDRRHQRYASPRSNSPSAARSMPPSPPSPSASPTSARPTACRSIAFIRAWSRPSGNGSASAPRWSGPVRRRPRSASTSAARWISRATARSRTWPIS